MVTCPCFRHPSDRGSIAIALVFVILAGASMLVIGALVLQGQTLSGRDVARENSLRSAEVGLDRAVALVRADPARDAATVAVAAWTKVAPGSNYEYKVSATKVSSANGFPQWTLDAYGRGKNGLGQRHIQRTVATSPLADVAVFARISLTMNGATLVDSYNSGNANGNAVTRPNKNKVSMTYPTNHGRVATEGTLDLRGNTATSVDGVDLYYAKQAWLPAGEPQLDDNATGDCLGPKCGSTIPVTGHQGRLPDPALTICDTASYTASYPGKLKYGLNSFKDTDITIDENSIPSYDPTQQPVILCARGKITFDGHSDGINMYNANISGGAADWRPNPATSLWILLPQSSGAQPTLDFKNHCELAGVVYAPSASFESATQCDFYGSFFVNSLATKGGLGVHYDDALQNAKISMPVTVGPWVEK